MCFNTLVLHGILSCTFCKHMFHLAKSRDILPLVCLEADYDFGQSSNLIWDVRVLLPITARFARAVH